MTRNESATPVITTYLGLSGWYFMDSTLVNGLLDEVASRSAAVSPPLDRQDEYTVTYMVFAVDGAPTTYHDTAEEALFTAWDWVTE